MVRQCTAGETTGKFISISILTTRAQSHTVGSFPLVIFRQPIDMCCRISNKKHVLLQALRSSSCGSIADQHVYVVREIFNTPCRSPLVSAGALLFILVSWRVWDLCLSSQLKCSYCINSNGGRQRCSKNANREFKCSCSGNEITTRNICITWYRKTG